jgi:hypothetical protein
MGVVPTAVTLVGPVLSGRATYSTVEDRQVVFGSIRLRSEYPNRLPLALFYEHDTRALIGQVHRLEDHGRLGVFAVATVSAEGPAEIDWTVPRYFSLGYRSTARNRVRPSIALAVRDLDVHTLEEVSVMDSRGAKGVVPVAVVPGDIATMMRRGGWPNHLPVFVKDLLDRTQAEVQGTLGRRPLIIHDMTPPPPPKPVALTERYGPTAHQPAMKATPNLDAVRAVLAGNPSALHPATAATHVRTIRGEAHREPEAGTRHVRRNIGRILRVT